jgi:XRE family transcriptional regulator, regulator of sulfur utilization
MLGARTTLAAVILFGAGVSVGTQVAPAAPAAKITRSVLFSWESFVARPTATGAVRSVVRAPTTTLEELESHITTLNAGATTHAPHTHANEEMIIIREGTLEAYVNGTWTPMSTGSMVFFASMEPHAVRNNGTVPATYYVVNWAPPGLKVGSTPTRQEP